MKIVLVLTTIFAVTYSLFRNILGSECQVQTSDGNRTGVCKSPIECRLSGGKSGGRGSCSFNSCCIYEGQCGSVTSKKVSYFYSPNYQNFPESDICSFTVRATSTAVCQVRLDFEDFEVAPPKIIGTNAASCVDDNFEVTAPNRFEIPRICGYNTGQHMYIPMNASNDELSIKLTMSIKRNRGSIPNPKWKIRITQLECPSVRALSDKNAQGYSTNTARDAYKIAPLGCLQYFTEKTGTFSTFNYRSNAAGAAMSSNLYIGNLNYAICFQRRINTCGLRISALQDQFRMGLDNQPCSDYLFIPETEPVNNNGGMVQTVTNYKYCGTQLNKDTSAVTEMKVKYPAPLYVHFKSDAMDTSDNAMQSLENGFRLTWDLESSCN